MSSAERFIAIRSAFGLNQADMAEKAGVKRDSWRRYEAGDLPTGETLERIAEMGFSIDWLLTGRGQMENSVASPLAKDRDATSTISAGHDSGTAETILRSIPQYKIPEELDAVVSTIVGLLRWGPGGYRVALVNAQHLVQLLEERIAKTTEN